MTLRGSLARSGPPAAVAVVALLLGLLPRLGRCQIAPDQVSQIRTGLENRIEALTILGGDFGLQVAPRASAGAGSFARGVGRDQGWGRPSRLRP